MLRQQNLKWGLTKEGNLHYIVLKNFKYLKIILDSFTAALQKSMLINIKSFSYILFNII